MNITLIGGSRGTGAALAELALSAGHAVTVVSRSGTAPAGARVVTGSAADPAIAAAAVAGADAVVVTVGGAKGVRRARAAVTESVVAAMTATGSTRLLVQSSLGAGGSATQLPAVAGFITKLVLAGPLADHNAQEDAVRRSTLDWTIVRPTGLTNAGPTGTWAALAETDPGTLTGTLPRRDLAAFLLAAITDDTTIGAELGISSR